MKILVTGSLGFMGSHLAEYLSFNGHEVIGMDNLSTGFNANGTDDVLTHKVDLVLEPERVSHIIEEFQPDIVYHLAAWAHEGLSQFCPIKITENNYNATLNVLIPAIRVGVKRFVFTSSMSVYGDGIPPFDESMERAPADIYAVAKTASERAIELLSSVHNFDYTIIRPHNVYGEKQNLSDPYRNVVGIFMRRVLNNQPLVVYGDGEQTRAFSYIDDVTPYLAKAGWAPESSKEIINIGPLEEFTINHLAETVSKIAGKPAVIEHVPDRPLEVKHAYCTNDKAQRLLGYKTSVTFEEGLTNMFNWAKELHDGGGIADPKYLDELEIVNESTPKTWTKKSL